jgi:hypothetical protein
MESQQKRIAIGAIACVLVVCLFFPFLLSTRISAPPINREPLSFDAAHAHHIAQEFVTRFPKRIFGSLESRPATGYFHYYLEELGYEIEYTHFDARIIRRKEVGRNVLGFKPGQSPEILAVVSHYDTARTTVQGAMKNGAAVGVLLELARIFSSVPTRRSLLFILSDGGEWGMLGARDLAEDYSERHRIVAVLSLDNVGIGDLAGFRLEETGHRKGFTPPWLRQLARRAAEAQGLPVMEPSGIREHLERAWHIPWADQGPFLEAGIPAINLGSISSDRAREKSVYHSPQDTAENLKTASIEKYGLAAECIVRTLDGMPAVPGYSPGFFKVRDQHYLKPQIVLILHVLAFLPLAVVFYFHVKNHRLQLNQTGIYRELLAYSGTILPFLTIFFFIRMVHALRLIPLYNLYPATAKDPVLENPRWGLLSAIFGTAVFVAAVCYIIERYTFRNSPKPQFHASKLVLLGILLILVVLALLNNSYWASAFFVLPAWIWPLAGCGRSFFRKIGNGIWIFAAGVVYYAALWMFASRLELGWNFLWYQVLALSTGLFSATGYLLGAAIIALGIRFLTIQAHDTA